MRVLHINGNYIYTALHQNMIISLNQVGISNDVFVPVFDSERGIIKPIESVQVVKCFNKTDRLCFHIKQKKIYKALKQRTKLESYDCIHAYTLFSDGYCAMKASKQYGIPYVVAVRNTDVNMFFKYMLHLRDIGLMVLENASKVFFLSEPYKKAVIEKYVPARLKEIIDSKSVIIPNGIDSFWLSNIYNSKDISESLARFSNKTIRLIYTGTINRNKNIGLTTKAMELLKNQGWKVALEVVGPIADQSIYQQIVRNENVSYTKKLPKEELIKKYREADIFVMPSHTESFGLVYVEAMSQGLPVIYTKGQGFDGQFPEGKVGYAVDDRNASGIAAAIKEAAERYEELSNHAVEGSKRFQWDDICRNYAGIYSAVVRNAT